MKLNKLFKLFMLVLVVISVALLIWGFAAGFMTNDAQAVDALLYYGYIMVGIAVAAWVLVGLVIAVKNNPKSLIKLGGLLVAGVVLCLVSYLLAPGTPAMGRENIIPADTPGVLKLTDTILNLTYIAGALAIFAIIVAIIFSFSVCFATNFLSIKHSSFHYFLDQVIKDSQIDKSLVIFSCNSYKDVITPNQGSIFSLNSTTIEVNRCSFIRVVSSSYPACFYIDKSNVEISYCYFFSCYAQGGNMKFGNAFYCNDCHVVLKCTYTLSCSPSDVDQDIVGDSAIALCYSHSLHMSYVNSSKCYGKTGAASVSYRDSVCSESFLFYITITDPHDHNCLESQGSEQKSYIYYANIVNSSSCSNIVFCNSDSDFAIFKYSVFINPKSTFASKSLA